MNDNKPALDGDRVFLGVETRLESGSLGPGLVSMARNTRMRNGKLETRRGIVKMNWVGRRAALFPLEFPVDFQERTPFVTVFGAGRWNDPNEVEWILIAASITLSMGPKVYGTRPGNEMVEIPLPAGETIAGDVSFVQAFSKMFLFRGEEQAPLVMETMAEGFRALSLTDDDITAGLSVIPNAETALWIQNRLVAPHGRDVVDVSDALDPEHVFAVTNRFRINQGSSDKMTALVKFGETTVIVGKEENIYGVFNLTPDGDGRFSNAVLDSVTSAFGIVGRRAAVQYGARVFVFSQKGVMSLRQTELNKIQAEPLPLSAPMQAIIERINWRFKSGIALAEWDCKLYCAVPLDNAEALGNEMIPAGSRYNRFSIQMFGFEPGRRYRIILGANEAVVNLGAAGNFTATLHPQVEFTATQNTATFGTINSNALLTASVMELFSGINNAVMVYDFIREQWDGLDDGRAVLVKDWVKGIYQGAERLFFISQDGFLNLYEEGYEDDVWQWSAYPGGLEDDAGIDQGVASMAPETEWDLRGYGLRALQNDGMSRADMGESRPRSVLLELRTWAPNYSIFAKADGVSEEIALIEGRTRSRTRYQRYGVADWDPSNVNDDFEQPFREDYSLALPAAGIHLGSGLRLGLHQDCQERVRGHGRAQAMQVRILNTAGRIELLRTEVESSGGRKRFGSLF